MKFQQRHIGADKDDIAKMLKELACNSIDEFINKCTPAHIRRESELHFEELLSESWAMNEENTLNFLRDKMSASKPAVSFIGQGFSPSVLPSPILREILENPAWYTAYTPYQAEISQGRLEALMNFQTLICELTGLDIANASLLDEASACAEAMRIAQNACRDQKSNVFLVDSNILPQNLAVLQTRAKCNKIRLHQFSMEEFSANEFSANEEDKIASKLQNVFGVIIQYPGANGEISHFSQLIKKAQANKISVIFACDPLALCLLKSPAELGADIAVGSACRFGMPLGNGGPHAGFIAATKKLQRRLPGRIVGLSKDARGNPAYRLALQTREQHIRRERAVSNVCTAQSLPAIIASFYALYHGRKGLRNIANKVHAQSSFLAAKLAKYGHKILSKNFFDCFELELKEVKPSAAQLRRRGLNLKPSPIEFAVNSKNKRLLSIAVDETKSPKEINILLELLTSKKFASTNKYNPSAKSKLAEIPNNLLREDNFLMQKTFSSYHSENALIRYIRKLENRDYSLLNGMIPLGSCTMKLNAASQMRSLSLPAIADTHPFSKLRHSGWEFLCEDLVVKIRAITELPAVTLQPNAGSQGEFAGLLAIANYFKRKNDKKRNLCLIPESAHGTNPASAVMAGMRVLPIASEENGDIAIDDLRTKLNERGEEVAAIMITYPSTHGIFEEKILEISKLVHSVGAKVYLDGANLNALVGISSPAKLGADVCHLNLHKTFAIPHGGGGPGVGPVAASAELAPFLPHCFFKDKILNSSLQYAVCSAPMGSASILAISWLYMAMLGADGLKEATKVAILNANFIAKKLSKFFDILFKGKNGFVAHECIIDLRRFKEECDISVEDIAKRLIDYGFHAPTMSWPVAGCLMVEPTESEPLVELERFCQAMLGIGKELSAITNGKLDKRDNPLKNAPHTAREICSKEWNHSYSRELAAFPLSHWKLENREQFAPDKYWSPVARVDNVFGDRNPICVCDPVALYAQEF